MNCASVEFFFRVSSVCFGCVSCQGARGEGHMAGTEPLLIGIDSLIMKCGICGSQIMVLILARDTTHWAVRVLSSSSVPAHLPINWLEGA